MDSKARVRYHLTTDNREVRSISHSHQSVSTLSRFSTMEQRIVYVDNLKRSKSSANIQLLRSSSNTIFLKLSLIGGIHEQVIESFVTKLLQNEKYLREPQIIALLGLNGEDRFDISSIEKLNFVETAKRARKHFVLFDTDQEKKQFAVNFHFVLLGLSLIGSTFVTLV